MQLEAAKFTISHLQEVAHGELIAYTPNMTLMRFTDIYAEPPNSAYATRVAQALGVSVDSPIKDLLV